MSLPLAIALVVLADLAVIAALAFVMTRARLLTPHGQETALPARPSARARHRRRFPAPARSRLAPQA